MSLFWIIQMLLWKQRAAQGFPQPTCAVVFTIKLRPKNRILIGLH